MAVEGSSMVGAAMEQRSYFSWERSQVIADVALSRRFCWTSGPHLVTDLWVPLLTAAVKTQNSILSKRV